jgi:hypothetical protein
MRIFLLLLLLPACNPRTLIVPVPSDDCVLACDRLYRMNCEEGLNPFCIEICVNSHLNGYDMSPECALESYSCEEFRICYETR